MSGSTRRESIAVLPVLFRKRLVGVMCTSRRITAGSRIPGTRRSYQVKEGHEGTGS